MWRCLQSRHAKHLQLQVAVEKLQHICWYLLLRGASSRVALLQVLSQKVLLRVLDTGLSPLKIVSWTNEKEVCTNLCHDRSKIIKPTQIFNLPPSTTTTQKSKKQEDSNIFIPPFLPPPSKHAPKIVYISAILKHCKRNTCFVYCVDIKEKYFNTGVTCFFFNVFIILKGISFACFVMVNKEKKELSYAWIHARSPLILV